MNKEEFNQKMTEVASILGMTWVLQPEYSDNTGEMKGENDICISVRSGGKQGKERIRFSSIYPRDSKNQIHAWREDVEISMSETKSADRIAKDIRLRFLSIYLNNLQKIKDINTKKNTFYLNKENNIKLIANHFGWEVGNDNSIYSNIPEIYSRIETINDKVIEFKVRCLPEKAIEVIEVFMEKPKLKLLRRK